MQILFSPFFPTMKGDRFSQIMCSNNYNQYKAISKYFHGILLHHANMGTKWVASLFEAQRRVQDFFIKGRHLRFLSPFPLLLFHFLLYLFQLLLYLLSFSTASFTIPPPRIDQGHEPPVRLRCTRLCWCGLRIY